MVEAEVGSRMEDRGKGLENPAYPGPDHGCPTEGEGADAHGKAETCRAGGHQGPSSAAAVPGTSLCESQPARLQVLLR